MDLNQIAERLHDAPSIQQGMAIMLAKQYLKDPTPVQTRDEFIKGITKELGITEDLLRWGFEYVESGGSILLLNKDGHSENKRRSRTSKEDRAKHKKI